MSQSAIDSGGAPRRWRDTRRESARHAIVDAAWEAVRSEGLAGLSIRDLAKRVGITTPTIYAYFESKHAIYDAMFGSAASEFADLMAAPYGAGAPRDVLAEGLRRFVEFCTSDPARYQLLFQRTIPGFEPSPDSYQLAVGLLQRGAEQLAAAGIDHPGALDLWTAVVGGLSAQQVANEPGGTRWLGLVDDAVDMFFTYMRQPRRDA